MKFTLDFRNHFIKFVNLITKSKQKKSLPTLPLSLPYNRESVRKKIGKDISVNGGRKELSELGHIHERGVCYSIHIGGSKEERRRTRRHCLQSLK